MPNGILNIDHETREVLRLAINAARELGREYCTSGDLLLALSTHSSGQRELLRRGLDQRAIQMIPSVVLHTPNTEDSGEHGLSSDLTVTLSRAIELSDRFTADSDPVLTLKATTSALIESHSVAREVLSRFGLEANEYLTEVEGQTEQRQPAGTPAQETPTLQRFSTDLTQAANQGMIDPVIGREQELRQIVEILSRRKKNNVALIGEAGVGKTALAEGLALALAAGDVPALDGARVVSLDLAQLTAGSAIRGAMEERLTEIINEVENSRQEIIVFIDEAHALAASGPPSPESGAVGEILKPALARGKFRVIAATTFAEYRNIERDAALARRFSPVTINEPDGDDLQQILAGLADHYADYHQVEIGEPALQACIALSSRYLSSGHQPDKSIDLLDTAAAKVRVDHLGNNRDNKVLSPADIATAVAERTGIPAGELLRDDREKFISLDETLGDRIIGHREIIAQLSLALKTSRAGIGQRQRPIGTFLFTGPTGVGKTELAKALAQEVFGSEEALTRIDMSEYQAEYSISRLIGAPPGYVGYGRGGQLTEAVYRRPYSVVLFDEIEKAHPDVHNLLLQLLDDGRLTDSEGKVVDFTNTIVIMTSNAGSRESAKRSPGFAAADSPGQRFTKALDGAFPPEFLGRVDYIARFSGLGQEQIIAIANKLVGELVERVSEQGYTLVVEDSVIDSLAAAGYSEKSGAREMSRVIRQQLEGPVAEALLDPETPRGATITIHHNAAGEIKLRRRKR